MALVFWALLAGGGASGRAVAIAAAASTTATEESSTPLLLRVMDTAMMICHLNERSSCVQAQAEVKISFKRHSWVYDVISHPRLPALIVLTACIEMLAIHPRQHARGNQLACNFASL